jgi:hypothetical protein
MQSDAYQEYILRKLQYLRDTSEISRSRVIKRKCCKNKTNSQWKGIVIYVRSYVDTFITCAKNEILRTKRQVQIHLFDEQTPFFVSGQIIWQASFTEKLKQSG